MSTVGSVLKREEEKEDEAVDTPRRGRHKLQSQQSGDRCVCVCGSSYVSYREPLV